MNAREDRTPPPEAWARQERARLAARGGDPAPAGVDAADLAIARALRAPPPVELPADFAAALAHRAGLAPAVRDPDARLAGAGVAALLALLGLAALAVAAFPLAGLADALSATAARLPLGWIAALGGCVLLSWAMERLLPPAVGPARAL
ncbi:hypothetical protein LDO32_15265 [Luteimonas sp. Y-2-2-4F]|nr:hypothetical protein [Luteimonas sp. Y-2-2-4F]MCD9033087.1 hypothetical protein [Luteimonas sp. Y-2-2-4F]